MKKLLFLVSILLLTSCESQNEDVVQTIDKSGAIEVEMTTKHCGDKDVLVTLQRVWVSKTYYTTFYHIDTIPSLGQIQTDGTDANGNDVKVTVQKDYEFYISVQ